MHAARTLRRHLALATVALLATACATGGASIGPSLRTSSLVRPTDAERRSHGNGDYISFQEVARERASTAWDLVERLRPYYRRGRSIGFRDATPIVYLDDMMLGNIGELRSIAANDVFEIRYVKGEEMRTRWMEASGHQVIQVVSKR